ncbi:hypothetical protein CW362_32770 [Streptomyces populi]|uniref:Uncharacterized protein n=1 Tax=Streptomyces populi TaxID=2058924 RepID=A0A2I0SG25_9ACTN|nr:hypothetical protein CW362_32770 [Streptomyces populi]
MYDREDENTGRATPGDHDDTRDAVRGAGRAVRAGCAKPLATDTAVTAPAVTPRSARAAASGGGAADGTGAGPGAGPGVRPCRPAVGSGGPSPADPARSQRVRAEPGQ